MLTGEFTGIKVLATVTVAVALVLAALAVYLCLNRNKQSWNGKGDHRILHYESTLAVSISEWGHTEDCICLTLYWQCLTLQRSLLFPAWGEYNSRTPPLCSHTIKTDLILQNSLFGLFAIRFLFSSPQSPHAALLPMKGKQFKVSNLKGKNISFEMHFCNLQDASFSGSTQSERVTLRIPPPGRMISQQVPHRFLFVWHHHRLHYNKTKIITNGINGFSDPDNESDTEVPYADIMITVRGVSTPELTQVGYLMAGEQKEVRHGSKHDGYLCFFKLRFTGWLNSPGSVSSSLLCAVAHIPVHYCKLLCALQKMPVFWWAQGGVITTQTIGAVRFISYCKSSNVYLTCSCFFFFLHISHVRNGINKWIIAELFGKMVILFKGLTQIYV